MSIKYQLSKHVRTIILVSMDMNEDQNLGYLFSNGNYQQEQFLNYVLQEDNGQFNFQSSPNNVEEATFLQKTNQGQGGQIFEERERIFQDVSQGNGEMLDQAEEANNTEIVADSSRNDRQEDQPQSLAERVLSLKEAQLRLKEQKLRLEEKELRIVQDRQKIIMNITEMVNNSRESPPEERRTILQLSKTMLEQLKAKRSRTPSSSSSREKRKVQQGQKRGYHRFTPQKKEQVKTLIKQQKTMFQVASESGISVSNLKIYIKQLRETGQLKKGMI